MVSEHLVAQEFMLEFISVCIYAVSSRIACTVSILLCVVLCFVYTLVDMNEKEKKGSK